MPTRTVDLTNQLDSFIEAGVQSGRYADAGEVVRQGLTLLEQQEAVYRAKVEWLDNAAREAFASIDRGEGMHFNSIEDLTAYIDKVGEEIIAEQDFE